MSGRAFRRALQQQISQGEEVDEELEEQVENNQSVPVNAFALLQEEEELEEEEKEGNHEDKTKQTKPAPVARPARKSKPRKRNKRKPKVEEDVEKLIESLALNKQSNKGKEKRDDQARVTNQSEDGTPKSSTATSKNDESPILSISAKFLNAELELCRLFGSKTVAAQRKESSNFRAKKKSVLIHPNLAWPRFSSDGVSMELVRSKKWDQLL
jgi:outer membrane biosynthesis protein TonB